MRRSAIDAATDSQTCVKRALLCRRPWRSHRPTGRSTVDVDVARGPHQARDTALGIAVVLRTTSPRPTFARVRHSAASVLPMWAEVATTESFPQLVYEHRAVDGLSACAGCMRGCVMPRASRRSLYARQRLWLLVGGQGLPPCKTLGTGRGERHGERRGELWAVGPAKARGEARGTARGAPRPPMRAIVRQPRQLMRRAWRPQGDARQQPEQPRGRDTRPERECKRTRASTPNPNGPRALGRRNWSRLLAVTSQKSHIAAMSARHASRRNPRTRPASNTLFRTPAALRRAHQPCWEALPRGDRGAARRAGPCARQWRHIAPAHGIYSAVLHERHARHEIVRNGTWPPFSCAGRLAAALCCDAARSVAPRCRAITLPP